MSAQFVDNMTLGQAVPLAALAEAKIGAATGPALAKLNAQLAAALAAQARLQLNPPTLLANAQAALAAAAALQAAISLGLPGVDFQLTAVATLIASLQAQIAALQISLGVNVNTPGVYLYRYSGRNDLIASGFYNVLGSGLPGASPSEHTEAWLLAAVAPEAQVTLDIVLGG